MTSIVGKSVGISVLVMPWCCIFYFSFFFIALSRCNSEYYLWFIFLLTAVAILGRMHKATVIPYVSNSFN